MGTGVSLCRPCLCSRCCWIYHFPLAGLLPRCLPPTANPIRNLLLGTAPECAEGSLTQRLVENSWATGRGVAGREAKPSSCLIPVPSLPQEPGLLHSPPSQEQLQGQKPPRSAPKPSFCAQGLIPARENSGVETCVPVPSTGGSGVGAANEPVAAGGERSFQQRQTVWADPLGAQLTAHSPAGSPGFCKNLPPLPNIYRDLDDLEPSLLWTWCWWSREELSSAQRHLPQAWRQNQNLSYLFLLQNVPKNTPNCFNHADGKGAEAEHFVATISSI